MYAFKAYYIVHQHLRPAPTPINVPNVPPLCSIVLPIFPISSRPLNPDL